MRDYVLEVSFDARDASLEELVQSRLFVTQSTGNTSAEKDGVVTISAYFDSPADRDAAIAAMAGLQGLRFETADRERRDWLELYQQSLEPLTIGSRFVVAPDAGLLPLDTDRLTLVVPQEQAFGTGSHETTALCIESLEELSPEGQSGLDVGSGSGILALAMLRLGAARVIAFDNDPDAYAALRENRERNGIAESSMPLFIGSIEALRGGVFDIVTMNIIPEVILPLLGSVVPRLARAGRLVLSGILLTRRAEVVGAARSHGLMLLAERERGEWWAGVFAPGSQS